MPRFGKLVRWVCGCTGIAEFDHAPTQEEVGQVEAMLCKKHEEEARTGRQARPKPVPTSGPRPLKGSTAQVNWAEGIRQGKLPLVRKFLRDWEEIIYKQPEHPDYQKALRKLSLARNHLETLERLTDARWWIDHRDQTPRELLGAVTPIGDLRRQ